MMQTDLFFYGIQTNTRFKITLFIRTKQNMQISGVIPFIKLTTKKDEKKRKKKKTLKQKLNGEKQ